MKTRSKKKRTSSGKNLKRIGLCAAWKFNANGRRTIELKTILAWKKFENSRNDNGRKIKDLSKETTQHFSKKDIHKNIHDENTYDRAESGFRKNRNAQDHIFTI